MGTTVLVHDCEGEMMGIGATVKLRRDDQNLLGKIIEVAPLMRLVRVEWEDSSRRTTSSHHCQEIKLVEKASVPFSPAPLTGGSNDYYQQPVINPTTPGRSPYIAEANDIIEALGLDFAEGNILKALWRRAAARKGKSKAGTTDLYDAEKIAFFAARVLVSAKELSQK